MRSSMTETKVLYYRRSKNHQHTINYSHYELVEFVCNKPRVLAGFNRMLELKKFVRKNHDDCRLKRLSKHHNGHDGPLLEEVDHVYLPLKGEAIRDLEWGMSWKKVARMEQLEGDEAHLKKVEELLGHDIQIYFGFNEWSNSGLEYITFSSPEKDFYRAMKEELTESYGQPGITVDFRGLNRLLKDRMLRDEEMLSHFIQDPDSHRFNEFIRNDSALCFRSARYWELEDTVIQCYKKHDNCPGQRNSINNPYIFEFLPTALFDFFEESFAQLYMHV